MPFFKLSLMFLFGFLMLMVNGAPSKPNGFQFNSSDNKTKTDDLLKQSVLGTGCDFLKCNEYCQRMGKAGGYCVGDACYCNHFEAQSKDKQSSGNKLLLAQESDPKPNNFLEKGVSDDGCDFLKCNEYCREIGSSGGYCLGDACYCDHFEVQSKDKQLSGSSSAQKSDPKTNGFLKKAVSYDGCETSECILYCQRMGKAGGHCVGDSCYCFGLETQTKDKQSSENKLLSAQKTDPKINDFSKKPVPYDGCETSECIMYCQRMGKAGGYCLENACYCIGLEAQLEDKQLSRSSSTQKTN